MPAPSDSPAPTSPRWRPRYARIAAWPARSRSPASFAISPRSTTSPSRCRRTPATAFGSGARRAPRPPCASRPAPASSRSASPPARRRRSASTPRSAARTWARKCRPDAAAGRAGGGLRREPGAVRHHARRGCWPDGDAARPQRHGQDHHGAGGHGHRAGAGRARVVRRPSAPWPAAAPGGPGRAGPGARGAPGVSQPHRAREPGRHRGQSPPPAGAVDRRARVRPATPARGPRAKHGRHAVGRRAADARHRSRADDQPEAADPRRGDRGPGAADPRRDLGLSGAPEGERAVDPAHRQARGRAHPAGRPSLRAREGSRGVERHLGRVARARRRPASIPRRLTRRGLRPPSETPPRKGLAPAKPALESGDTMSWIDPHFPKAATLSPLVGRVLGLNPGMMTGPGTNTYLIGRSDPILLDTGSGVPEYMTELQGYLAERDWTQPSRVVLTHRHRDHLGGVPHLRERYRGVHVGKMIHRDADLPEGVEDLRDGATIAGDGVTLRAIHTPGHASDHLCYYLAEENAVFTGDVVLGGSTTVIPAEDGDLLDYMSSLKRLQQLGVTRIYPAHGPVIEDAQGKLTEYIE